MFYLLKTVSLLCIATATVTMSAPFQIKGIGCILPMLQNSAHVNSHTQQKSHTLAKTSALVTKQIGSTHYLNSADTGKPAEWTFESRDTIIYDAAGNEIIKKSSRAHSGWDLDSLKSLDSSLYSDGNLTEIVTLYYNSGAISVGSRYSYALLDSGKNMVCIYFDWVNVKNKWVENQKFSIKYSAPVKLFLSDSYSNSINTISEDIYIFDTSSLSWEISGHLAKIDTECNEKSFVLGGQLNGSDYKSVMIFKTLDWSDANIDDVSWNMAEYKIKTFFDSYSNDTLTQHYYYDSSFSTWDTTMIHYARTYDANGKNIITINSECHKSEIWQSKDVNIFSQIDVPVNHLIQAKPMRKISIITTPSTVHFEAPEITALNIFNATGRLIISIKQKASPSLYLDLAKTNCSITSGTYIAELVNKSGRNAYKIMLRR